MFSLLLTAHSIIRWLLLGALCVAIARAAKGYFSKGDFNKTDNAIRHWTATISHVQLVIGMTLYMKSPIVKLWYGKHNGVQLDRAFAFFGVAHIAMMMVAIIVITVGSALSKRRIDDFDKFKTMLTWYTLALAIIMLAIPWPHSPLASRPWIRIF